MPDGRIGAPGCFLERRLSSSSRHYENPATGWGFFLAQFPETPPELPRPASYAGSMNDDCEAYKFTKAPFSARQVDRKTAQMMVEAAAAHLRCQQTLAKSVLLNGRIFFREKFSEDKQ